MSPIDAHNVEEWIFNHVEGNLSPDEEATLEEFLRQNPQHKADLAAWKASFVVAEPVTYANAGRLTRPAKWLIPGFGKWGMGILGAIALIAGLTALIWTTSQTPDYPPGKHARGLQNAPKVRLPAPAALESVDTRPDKAATTVPLDSVPHRSGTPISNSLSSSHTKAAPDKSGFIPMLSEEQAVVDSAPKPRQVTAPAADSTPPSANVPYNRVFLPPPAWDFSDMDTATKPKVNFPSKGQEQKKKRKKRKRLKTVPLSEDMF